MAVHESIRLPIPTLVVPARNRKGWCFADYMLSGVFRGDMHRTPELQYGFQSEDGDEDDDVTNHGNVERQVKALDGHIRAYTARELKLESDSLNAFLGISARYTRSDEGLSLILGIPVWKGKFADGKPGLELSFAMSLSLWVHVGKRDEPGSGLYIANSPRRSQFPSWSWIGWGGPVDFNNDNTDNESRRNKWGTSGNYQENGDIDDEHDNYLASDSEKDMGDNAHIDLFSAMTSPGWIGGVKPIYHATMVLHTGDYAYSAVLSGSVALDNVSVDADKKWQLTIKEPLVLRHLHLTNSGDDSSMWEWRCLMDKEVEMRLSVPLSERQLTDGHANGEMVSVLLFAGTVPFVFDGRARFLILRRVRTKSGVLVEQWERIGRLVLTIEEWDMDTYRRSTQAMIDDLPVREYGRDLILV